MRPSAGSTRRVAGTADLAQDLLEAEQQVAVSVAFLETSAAFVEKLTGRRWRVGDINGRQSGATNAARRDRGGERNLARHGDSERYADKLVHPFIRRLYHMSGSYDHRQAKIDALLSNAQSHKISVQKKLLELALKGTNHPADLTDKEIQTLCFALFVHCYKMSIE